MCENGATLKNNGCTCGCANGYGGDNCESESTLHTTPIIIFMHLNSTNAEDPSAILCDQLPTLNSH